MLALAPYAVSKDTKYKSSPLAYGKGHGHPLEKGHYRQERDPGKEFVTLE